jgi:predicted kinase
MDLEHLGHPDVSRYFLSAYVQKADDPTLYSLLDFYATYRAVVKMKVLCLQFMEVEEGGKRDVLKNKAEQYLQQAYRYAIQFSRPTLWIFCGLPATGKSQMSEKLARAFSASLLRSDVIRKDLVGLGDQEVVVPYGADIYRRERRNLVYARMLSLAQEELKGGRSVILDASFSLRKWRDEARQLARDLDTSFIVIECRCSQESIEKRLKMRERIPGASDARIQHLPSMIKAFEPLLEVAPEALIQLDTDLPPEKVLMNLLAGSYAKRCEQVERVMRQLD